MEESLEVNFYLDKEEVIEKITQANTLNEIVNAFEDVMSLIEQSQYMDEETKLEKGLTPEEEETLMDILNYTLENKAKNIIYVINKKIEEAGKPSAQKAEDKGFYYKEEQRIKKLRKQEERKLGNFLEHISSLLVKRGIKPNKANGIKTEAGILYLRKSDTKVYPEVNYLKDEFKRYKISECVIPYDIYKLIPEEVKEYLKIESEVDKKKVDLDETLSKEIRIETKFKVAIS